MVPYWGESRERNPGTGALARARHAPAGEAASLGRQQRDDDPRDSAGDEEHREHPSHEQPGEGARGEHGEGGGRDDRDEEHPRADPEREEHRRRDEARALAHAPTTRATPFRKGLVARSRAIVVDGP